jgi:diguanylate cyclase (GGDEF)-like protein
VRVLTYNIGTGENGSRMPIGLTWDLKQFLSTQLTVFWGDLDRSEIMPINAALQCRKPLPAIAACVQEMEGLRKALDAHTMRDQPVVLDDQFAPILKTILLAVRRLLSENVDERLEKTVHPTAIDTLREELAPFDELLQTPWCAGATPFVVPRMTDYLTLEEVEQVHKNLGVSLLPREYDEKFHLLQAPRLVLNDLNYYRKVSGARGLPVALAYVDIDGFKALNTKYRHEMIDKNLLPTFMRTLEAATFARGHAYRYGGDEYAIILGNGKGAAIILDDLRQEIARLAYLGIQETTTVSIGFILITPDCELSNQQARERANRAMHHAKDNGKNCLATFNSGFNDDQLTILPTMLHATNTSS